ncbi:MAG: DUF5017 domain-containing protein [Mucilaginibacter sp.]|uniref:DUF5017 domain-containing protein n=1 Tax=Mucilaginibacter sp. TaxID=1882438 RepID=UPI0032635152
MTQRTLLLIALFATIFGCKKLGVSAPDLTVTTNKTVYTAGDTVHFKFSGQAGNIVFYSGEPGSNYANKDRDTADGIPQLQFTSTMTVGTQTNTLTLLATNDLAAIDSAHVVTANWTDITSRAKLSAGTALASGVIDLSDFKNSIKPLYLAFRYTGLKNTSAQRKWVISTFDVNNVLPDGSNGTISNIATAYWSAFNVKGPLVAWVIPATVTNITITGGAVANSDENEDWIVTKPLILNKIVPDAGVSIQNIGGNALTGYDYIFSSPGKYKVTFVAFNNSRDDQKSVIKELEIMVN